MGRRMRRTKVNFVSQKDYEFTSPLNSYTGYFVYLLYGGSEASHEASKPADNRSKETDNKEHSGWT